MYKTRNRKLQDYLFINGCRAYKLEHNTAYFKETPQLKKLLDSFYIEFVCIPNRAGLWEK